MSFMHALRAVIGPGMIALLLAGCTTAEPTPTPLPNPTATPTEAATPTTEPTAVPTAVPTETVPPPLEPGSGRVDAKGIEQLWVPAGTFLMGTGDTSELDPPGWAMSELASEQPQHEVQISNGYWIDKYEVTNEAFQAFVDDGGYLNQAYWSDAGWQWLSSKVIDRLPATCGMQAEPNNPRVCVTWFEAEAYARWRGGRLPTEAEWEFAARGPESLIYPWGNNFDASKANVVDSAGLTPVGNYPDGVSWIGAYDMAGNAMEWVQDWLGTHYYEEGESVDPQGPTSGGVKVEKGGWWGSNPFVARAAYRHFEDPPSYQDQHIGFRIVTPADPQE